MNITLLSALPHSRQDVEDARLNPLKDYVRSILLGYRMAGEAIWSQVEPELGSMASQVFEICRENGVTVIPGAGRAELQVAAVRSDLLIVLAHWKGPDVERKPLDVLVPPSRLRDALRSCVERGLLPPGESTEETWAGPDRVARDRLAIRLNEAIDRWEEWLPFADLVGPDIEAVVLGSAFARNHARSIIDEIFGPEDLLPGARLELADGLWRPSDVGDCFPEGWCGVCDFFCCTSEYLAEQVKCRHPRAVFRADSRLLEPGLVFPALREMIPRLRLELTTLEDLVPTYIRIAYECNSKYGKQ